uniref:N-acetyltransferase domain-containing protein n=1 Tax=Bigelowiella natans TaxID=227086 RepID=A0A7S2KL53_BIGNA
MAQPAASRMPPSEVGGRGCGVYTRPNLPGMEPGVQLREMTLIDIPQLRSLNEEHLAENYRSQFWERMILAFPGISMLLEDLQTGEILGYVLSTIHPEGNKREAEIVSLAVDWRCQKRGFGSLLVDTSVFKMRSKFNATSVMLYARGTTRAYVRRLYHRLGFKLKQELPRYYDDGESAHVLEAEIQREAFKADADIEENKVAPPQWPEDCADRPAYGEL